MLSKKNEINVEFHFRRKSFPFVQRIVGILEKEGIELFDYFSYRPSSTIHILLEEDWTRNNGSASIFPDNIVTIITFPPLGSSFLLGEDDPVKNLVIHELAHIVHLDQTGGVNRVLSRIFGSTGKLMPSAVPRWFSEGLATWAETRFTRGGRLRSAGVIWQLERSLLDPGFCSDISCLDSPGSFPYGSNSYWMGADFLTWIEDKKEGSVKCLVRENADNLAFFLNHAFVDCTGKSAGKLFIEYRKERREEIRRRQKLLRKNDFVKNFLIPLDINRLGPVDLERGASISEGKFYYLWHRRRGGERIGIWDLEKGTLESRKTPFFVPYILPPSGPLLPVGAQNNHLTRHRRRIVDLKSHRILLPQSIGADYAFALEGEKWLYFRWQGDRWAIGEYREQKNEIRILHLLPLGVSIKRPRLFLKDGRPWLSFQVFGENGAKPYQLWAWRLGDEKPKILVRKSDTFTYWDQCDGVHLLKDSSKGVELLEINVLDQIVSKKVTVAWADQISFMLWDADHAVVFLRDDPERAWHLPKGCGEIVRELSREVNDKSVRKVSQASRPPFPDIGGTIKEYSAWHYMRPSWWLLGARYKNDQLYTTLETSLEDPKRFHRVGLEMETPFRRDEFNFMGSYAHRLSDFREAYARIGYHHAERKTRWNSRTQTTSLSFHENFYLARVVWTPVLSLSQQKEEGLIHKLALSQRWVYRPVRSDAFFHRGVGHLRLARSWHRKHFSYMSGGIGLKIYLQPSKRLLMGFRVQYDKLFKKTVRGYLYGGGRDGLHSFYGLDYQDAWGDEILTARISLDSELMRIYSSWGLVPFYVKELRLLAGIDYIETDSIWLARDRYYTHKALSSNYWGVRLKLDLFYRNPVTWDFLRVNLRNPRGGRNVRYLFSFNLSF